MSASGSGGGREWATRESKRAPGRGAHLDAHPAAQCVRIIYLLLGGARGDPPRVSGRECGSQKHYNRGDRTQLQPPPPRVRLHPHIHYLSIILWVLKFVCFVQASREWAVPSSGTCALESLAFEGLLRIYNLFAAPEALPKYTSFH